MPDIGPRRSGLNILMLVEKEDDDEEEESITSVSYTHLSFQAIHSRGKFFWSLLYSFLSQEYFFSREIDHQPLFTNFYYETILFHTHAYTRVFLLSLPDKKCYPFNIC